jgi:glutaredoxin 3
MKNLELFYFFECPYCQLVLNVIEELGIKNQITLCNTRENFSYREKLQKATGKTQVPCLFIDGKPMFESIDIANWLKQHANEVKGN